jgi:uncharacterized membrane protein
VLFEKLRVKKLFFTGLVIALPLVITFGAMIYLINLFTAPFVQLLRRLLFFFFKDLDLSFFYLTHQQILLIISKILAVLLLFALISFLGFLGQRFLGKILKFLDALFHRIPLVNKIYTAIQQVVSTLFSQDRKIYRQVVIVPFPDPHNSCLGIVVGEALKACESAAKTELVSVLIPTCPVPLTGFIVMIPPKDLILIDMSIEEALKYILSCGILSSGQPFPIIPNPKDISPSNKL